MRPVSNATRRQPEGPQRPGDASCRDREPRRAWWQWLDFDSKLMAQVWSICCAQILILAVGGLVIHASAASPY